MLQQHRQRHFPELFPERYDAHRRILIYRPGLAQIGAPLRMQRFKLSPGCSVPHYPLLDRRFAEAGPHTARYLPSPGALVLHQFLGLAPLKRPVAHKVGDDPEPKCRYPLLPLFVHHYPPSSCDEKGYNGGSCRRNDTVRWRASLSTPCRD